MTYHNELTPTNSNETMPDLASNSTMSSNPWKIEWVNEEGRESDPTGWATCKDSGEKIEYLRMHTQEGYCYLWLVLLVEAFQDIGIAQFKELIDTFRTECGVLPPSERSLTQLLAICMIHLFPKGSNLSGKSLSIELINHMMESKVRMKYTDSDFLHIEPEDSYSFGCRCNDVFCRHGWSSRFIMTIVTQSQKALGATINFDEIVFDGEEGDEDFSDSRSHVSESTIRIQSPRNIEAPKPLFSGPTPVRTPQGPATVNYSPGFSNPQFSGLKRTNTDPGGSAQRGQGVETNNSPMEGFDAISRLANVVRIASQASKQAGGKITGDRDKASVNNKYIESVKRVIDEMNAMGLGPEGDSQDDLGPDDSSSNFGVRKRKQGTYMASGSVLQDIDEYLQLATENLPRTTLSGVNHAPKTLQLYKTQNSVAQNIVQGFMKTKQMIEEEQEAVASIKLINGLASPFKSDRLLILSHIHTALNTRKIKVEDPVSLSEGLARISESNGRTSSERLLITVVNSTFDIDKLVVVANAFNLPYIEIGMGISGAMLTKCFVQLSMEYEILWFNEMKGLRVPDFHSRFYSISESDPNTRSRVSTKSRASQDKQSDKRSSGKRKSSSILSFR